VGDRLAVLGDDDFFALADAIEELGDVGGGFRESDVGDHFGVLGGLIAAIISCGKWRSQFPCGEVDGATLGQWQSIRRNTPSPG
jgi:hypothetical protein